MGRLFSALGAKISMGINILMLVAIAFVVISKNGEIKSLDKSINDPVTGYKVLLSTAQSNLTQCRNNNLTLQNSIGQQNSSIDRLNKLAAETATLGKAANAAVKAEGAAQVARLDELIKQGTAGQTACERAENFIRESTR